VTALDRWLTRVENLLAGLGIAVLILIIGAVCSEILLRTFFARPQVWVIEFSEYGLLFITFLGTSWLMRQDGHVRVDLLTNALGVEGKRRLALVSAAIGCAVSVVLTVFGVIVTLDAQRRGVYKPTILEFPTWLVLVVIPLGSTLLTLRFLHRFAALWRRALDLK
jgi:TRAP-type C4-dicarboxylate transport system permease small subunit